MQTTRPQIIGLTGAVLAGKDTCASILEAYGFQRIAFADALREEISIAFDFTVDFLMMRDTKEVPLASLCIAQCRSLDFLRWAADRGLDFYEPRSPRWMLQTWGSEFRRGQDIDYWLRIVERWARYQVGAGRTRLVVTDVRMINEAALIASLGGFVVRVVRPELQVLRGTTATHESEVQRAALTSAAQIHNDGDLQHLEAECLRVLAELYPQEITA